MVMKKEKSFLMVMLLGFLTGALGLLIVPQSGLTQPPYTIRKAGSSKESMNDTLTIKADRLKTGDLVQEKIQEKVTPRVLKFIPKKKSALKVHSFIATEKPTLKARQFIPEDKSAPKALKFIPKFESRIGSREEESTEYNLQMKLIEGQREILPQFEIEKGSLKPAQKENTIVPKEVQIIQ
jgi:hypothetical protein